MGAARYAAGERVFAAEDIVNDGGMPGLAEDAVIAPAGTCGMVVQSGHAELDPSQTVYLVRFENGPEGALGDPVGVLPEELSQHWPAR
ncbi:nitrogen fixation protein NifZ [Denitromonas sp. IR12]|uniref:Nitrogen fixation protein NifZ n=1 Tax=Denitromonas iodatirespirans TaxID=2795389 RepID=A0A944DD44_DENI1|nr:nitrogen fixation protein NifZ [Denitromonas iodatirespirans]